MKLEKDKKEKIWIQRDLKIAEAVRAHDGWMEETKNSLEELHKEYIDAVAEIKAECLTECLEPELKFSRIRAQAVGLVLGLMDWQQSVAASQLCEEQKSLLASSEQDVYQFP